MLNYLKNLCLVVLLYFINCYQAVALANHEDFYYKTIVFEQQLLHTVTVNPNKYKIVNAIAATTTGKNVDALSRIARKHNALAAVNGGFFRAVADDLFVPAGPLKIMGVWHGIAYHPRAAIGWKDGSNLVVIDRLKTKTVIKAGNLNLPIFYFNPHYHVYQNKKYPQSKAVLYSSIYPDFLKLNNRFPNILIKKNNEFVYNYQADSSINSLYENGKISNNDLSMAELVIKIIPQLDQDTVDLWQEVDFITSGAPVLIKNHEQLPSYAQEKLSYQFIYNQYPRTAICILSNGFWKFVVTANMTIPELANAMQSLQCRDAINLDGGGSSSLYLSSNVQSELDVSSIVNPITDAILVLPK